MQTKDLESRIAKYCKDNPYEAMRTAELIYKKLQMLPVREFAAISTLSEKTVYNMVSDLENAKIEVAVLGGIKFIPKILNP